MPEVSKQDVVAILFTFNFKVMLDFSKNTAVLIKTLKRLDLNYINLIIISIVCPVLLQECFGVLPF